MDGSGRSKSESGDVPRVSQEAAAKFAKNLPKLLNLVNEKFAVEERLSERTVTGGRMELTRDAHAHFGRMLNATLEFGLYEDMDEEFGWYVSTLSARGLEERYFMRMIEGWIIAIHSAIEPPHSGELTHPLEWLRKRLHGYYAGRPEPATALSREGESFLNLILEGRRRDAVEYILSLRDTGFAPMRLFSDVILPALGQVGLMWQRNEIGVADEHAATEICRYVIYRVIDSMPADAPLPYKIIVACVPGEQHEMGARILADYLGTKGWAVKYLGRSTPEEDLVAAVTKRGVDVAILSVTLIENLPAARDLLSRIRERVPDMKTAVGGRAAIKARKVLEAYTDAVVSGFEQAHSVCLRLVGGDA
jgi:methanogenic corrinoid protein MtbC1